MGNRYSFIPDWIKLPQFRLPGFSDIERGDVLSFNYPSEIDKPIDLKTYYVKRCIGLPGDTLSIENGNIFINNNNYNEPGGLQNRYFKIRNQYKRQNI